MLRRPARTGVSAVKQAMQEGLRCMNPCSSEAMLWACLL